MKASEFHQKYLRKELNHTHLIQAVYDGPCGLLTEQEMLMVSANAAMLVHEAMKKYVREIKRCIVCGTPHTHNNAFCSAEHAEVYKMQSKGKQCFDV